MSDLDIVLKLDPTAPAAGARKVTDEVRKTEEQAVKARAAFDALSKSFASVGDAMRQRTAAALTTTSKAFDSLTEAIRREQKVLEAIHGPARRYAEDLQTLDSMLARNVINTREYADQVTRLNQQMGQASQGATKVARGGDLLAQWQGGGGGGSGGKLDSIARGVGALNFKQAAQGASQAFELLNNKLKITDTTLGSAVGSAIKFGATGAQIGGIWGAAIGGAVGLVSDLVGGLFESEAATRKLREEAERQGKAYWDGVKAAETKARVEAELAPVLAEQERLTRELAEREATRTQVMDAGADAVRRASDRAMAYHDQLSSVNGALATMIAWQAKLYGADPTAGGGQTDDESTAVKAQRGLRDATIESYAATKSYGAALSDLAKAENARKDRLADLEQIMGDINVAQEVRNRAFKEYNKLVHEGTDATTKHTKALKDQATWLTRGQLQSLANQEANAKLNLNEWMKRDPITGGTGPDWEAAQNNISAASREVAKMQDEAWARSQENAKRLREAIGSINDVFRDQLVASVQSLGDALLDAAHGADVGWMDTFAKIGRAIEKAIAQALILKALTGSVTGQAGPNGKAIGGLFGLLGFASGGTIFPSGSGTQDTQTVMFRKAPSETVRIQTPQQEMAYRRGGPEGGGGTSTVRVVNEADPRALYSDRDLVVGIAKNRDMIKRLIG